MLFNTLKSTSVVVFGLSMTAHAADEVHGSGAQGSVMGPVAFMWPADRPWSADVDNVAPCGSSAAISNRTAFPLGTPGSVSLTIADEAWNVAFRIAYGNNPSTQSVFQDIIGDIKEVDAGHQCYPVNGIPANTQTGSNATLQLEYWANDSNKNESFFACADITFVQASAFTLTPPCFNVTSEEFSGPGTTVGAPTIHSESPTPSQNSEASRDLSAGAKAGIAVGSVVGFLALLGAALFFVLRRRRSAKAKAQRDAEAAGFPPMKDTASFHSGKTAVQE